MRASESTMASLHPNAHANEPLLKRDNRFSRLSMRLNAVVADRQSILRIGEISGHGGNRFYNVLMDFIIFVLTTLEITIVLYLSISHFRGSGGSSLMALAMLLPILLNFIGVTYFLSDKVEKRELEMSSGSKCSTDFLQVPIIGPVFTALKVLRISGGCTTHCNYERIEATAIKMRQASSFFCASPEAIGQLIVLLTTQPKEEVDFDRALEIVAVLFFTITLAESNCYNTFSKYYQMFRDYEPMDWKLVNVELWQKVILFIHAFSSIGTRIIASAGLRAASLYFFKDSEFTLILAVTVLGEITYRIIVYYMSRCIKYFTLNKEIPSSCHESITYAWRSTILDYGFQSDNIAVQFLFYAENLFGFGFWCIGVFYGQPGAWVMDTVFYPMLITFVSLTILSIFSLLCCNFFRLIEIGSPFRKQKTPDIA